MQKTVNVIAALLLAAGIIYFMSLTKDDAEMAAFKQSVAGFVRGEKQSAPLRDVLARGGDKICARYEGNDGLEITIQDYKVLTVMKGSRNLVVDGKPYSIKMKGDCLAFKAATIWKNTGCLLIDGAKSKPADKPKQKQKQKPATKPAAKKPAQRSYGY